VITGVVADCNNLPYAYGWDERSASYAYANREYLYNQAFHSSLEKLVELGFNTYWANQSLHGTVIFYQ